MYLGGSESYFVSVVIAGCSDARKDVTHLWFVVNKLQQRLSACASFADTEYVFCGGIQADNQQVFVEQNNARTERVENRPGVGVDGAVVAGTARLVGAFYRIEFCCT